LHYWKGAAQFTTLYPIMTPFNSRRLYAGWILGWWCMWSSVPMMICEAFSVSSLLASRGDLRSTTASTGSTNVHPMLASRLSTLAISRCSSTTTRATTTQLYGIFQRFRRNKDKGDESSEESSLSLPVELEDDTEDTVVMEEVIVVEEEDDSEEASICIIGGGVAGLTAAITAANAKGKGKQNRKIVLLEAQDTFGGRVQTDRTPDGFLMDRGFAVFIEEYPTAKELLDYDALQLGKFQPGALVKIKNRRRLAKVADPFRQPEDIIASIVEPVGTIFDKINLLPLILNVKSKSVQDLFEERDTDTEYALEYRWNLGKDILDKFFRPFLEGIYLAPLNEQSSRMFSFIFKMFSEGAATLPAGGIGAIADQLASKARKAQVDLRAGQVVRELHCSKDGSYQVVTTDGTRICAKTVIIATDGAVAQRLVAQVPGFESLEDLPPQPQRKVGCMYYGFKGPPPVTDPILILNGIGAERGTRFYPVNNCCFPSVVQPSYAPNGYNLCSVTLLQNAVEYYEDMEGALDDVVRRQLVTWFPDAREAILHEWELKGIYDIANAQPSQYGGPWPAQVHGGRECNVYRGKTLPPGLLLCGDHVATATLNGAMESGKNAGLAASRM
jgi:phytoene dehydrogenase-like protein